MTDLVLYDYFRSSAAYRVRIALRLKGLSYDQIPAHLVRGGGEHLSDAYRAINPQRRVPALAIGDDRTILIQSSAIIEWLEETFPEPPLLPAEPFSRARCRAIAAIVGCDIHPLNNLSTLNYLRNQLGCDKPAVDAWYAHWIAEGFSAIEELIEPEPFAMGAKPTLADAYLVPQVYNARRFAVPLDAFPKIVAVAEACAALPVFRDAAPENQPDAE
ncbi:maleylacetoacetate isomerase [Mesorhizobium sp. LHD-90]|uniref:maleylacetoacetate isomerase n=1 Tax=Mesorhizobium sp. LHD-90 TaxID=3071414 RepID=UPI0027E0F477|nr:maleylacetoacetate isomerase [Mesorhizobium sp. LHD-90]MDQ6433811.1 maleylacetoacetate isomerase [Mesorhizobium sp. LHD-90]